MTKKKRADLRDAVFRGSLAEVAGALSEGTRVDEPDEDGRTALIHAAIDGQLAILDYLLTRGAGADWQDKLGFSALHYAAQNNHVEVARRLLQGGAQIDIRDKNGNTPLWRAMFAYQGDDAILKSLRAANANVDAKNNHGVSPRDLAATRGLNIAW